MRFSFFFINFFSTFLTFYFISFLFCNFNNIDLFFKINSNDNLIHYYSYFWLNYTYVYVFYFFIFSFFVIKQTTFTVCSACCLLYFLYLYEIFNNHITFNKSNNILNVLWNDVNMLLINNLNKYHPFLFYLNLIIIFWVLSFFLNFIAISGVLYYENVILIFLKKTMLWSVQLNFSILILGAWWAFQEGTWGGWWNWDPSELFGFFFLIWALFFTHAGWGKTHLKFHISNFFFFLNFIMLFYYFIQLNFDLTSHNFGLRFFFFFNNNFFFFEIFVTMFSFFFWTIKITIFQYNNLGLLIKIVSFERNFKKFYLSFIFISLFLLYVLFSNNMILNYFLWKVFKLNFFFNINQVDYLNFYSFFFLIFTYLSWQNSIFLIPFLTYLFNFLFISPFFLLIRFNSIFFIHFFLINFFLINLCVSNLTTLSFLFCNSLFKIDNVIYFNSITLNLQNIEIANTTVVLYNMICGWGQFCFSNFFFFFSSLNNFFAQTTLCFTSYCYFWKFIDLYVNYLSLSFMIVYIIFCYHIFFKCKTFTFF